jgi:F-type H+-transporting ATPase subunit b
MIRRFALLAMLILSLGCLSAGVAFSAAPKAEAAEGASKEAGEKKAESGNAAEGLNPITFKLDLSVWTAVVFLVVLAILSKYAWGPIADGLQKRENDIAGQIAEAQQRNEEARHILADYEKKLAAARDEVRVLIDDGRRDSEKVGQQVLEKAREESAIERQRAVQQIETATAAALKELAERSATLAVELAGKIVGAHLQAADHSRLIEQSLAEFARSNKINAN